ncbi:MAG: ATP-binding cassette domain-containing protein [Flavobacteriia bacterium]|nr:ATP-binding cassette domain-containing protein [Flavobacteriia bacterium]
MSEAELSASDVYMSPSVTFESPKRYLIRAESGHGKSSLLNFIFGSNPSFVGDINPKPNSSEEWRKSMLSYVFQDLKLFPELSVWDNLQLKNRLTQHKTDDEIKVYLNELGIDSKANEKVEKLSLGQRQRVAVIRALCQPFHMLLLDEPFSHLDDSNRAKIAALIERELDSRNAGLLVTSLGPDDTFNYDIEYRL